jgi:L-2-hydroxyglutarate oxidase LhgO
VDPSKAEQFWSAVRGFLPGLRLESLHPDTSGIRPKLQGPDDPWIDFVIQEESKSGRPGLVNLVGIDSPGLTSCLAIADEVWDLARPFLQ